MFSRFAVLAVGLTAQQSYNRSTFHRRGNNAVTQDPSTFRAELVAQPLLATVFALRYHGGSNDQLARNASPR